MDAVVESTVRDWGPWGRPLFDDPSARALERVGVVDIGSNSVRLVVFDGAARSPAYFYNEKIMCGLGAGLSQTGALNPDGRARALAALRRFQLLARQMELPPLSVVATAAVREASDGLDFCEDVLARTGLDVRVIDGPEEARLSAQGVLLGWPDASGLVCDIGGASMELAELQKGEVGRCLSSSLGPLRLLDIKGGKTGRKAHMRAVIADLHSQLGPRSERLFLVGGSWRAIARIDMQRRGYPLFVLHEYRMSTSDVLATARYIHDQSAEQISALCGISAARMALVPLAIEVLKTLVRQVRPKEIAVSSYGLREGLLYEQMPDQMRARDPLIEAARFAESKDARLPGSGKALYHFVQPLFKPLRDRDRRLIKAACLLHDVAWRAHPDYRAETCFDNATRANLGGLTHEDRVFLGLALLHRYRNRRNGTRFEALSELIDPKRAHLAEILGKAMRFGAMLGVQTRSELGGLRWFPQKKRLVLTLARETADLFGEIPKARFLSLAASLQAETEVKVSRRG